MDCLPNCLAPTSYYCHSCDITCSSCKSGGVHNCLACAGLLNFSSAGTCSVCPDGMYFDGFTCKNCSTDCLTCSSKNFCLSCSNPLKTANSLGLCVILCPYAYYLSGETCLACPNLCAKCDFGCSKCVDNASLDSNSKCSCNQGFNQTSNNCSPGYFSATLQINYQNTVKFQFLNPIPVNLTIANFSISIENITHFSCSVI